MSDKAYTLFLFPGTSHAVRAEQVLLNAGVDCKLIPVPRHISSECGVCLRVLRADRQAAEAALAAAHAEVEEIRDI